MSTKIKAVLSGLCIALIVAMLAGCALAVMHNADYQLDVQRLNIAEPILTEPSVAEQFGMDVLENEVFIVITVITANMTYAARMPLPVEWDVQSITSADMVFVGSRDAMHEWHLACEENMDGMIPLVAQWPPMCLESIPAFVQLPQVNEESAQMVIEFRNETSGIVGRFYRPAFAFTYNPALTADHYRVIFFSTQYEEYARWEAARSRY